MSLQIWLPLNGNLNNQGLCDITVSNLNSTGYTAGKIGQGMYLTTDGQGVSLNNYMNICSTYSTYSMSAWVYLDSTATNHSSSILSSGNWNSWVSQCVFGLYNYSSGYSILLVPNKSSWGYGISISSSKIQLNKWYHIAITYDGNVTNGYINGNYIGSYNGGGITSTSENNSLYIGRATYYNGFTLKGKINDVRIYDHCLSKKEVKELAKGLVLHYRLAGPGQENLVQDGLTEITCRSQAQDYPVKVINTLKDNTQYTLSFDAKSENGLGTFYCSLSNNSSSQIYFKTQIKPTTTFTHYEYTVTRRTQTTNRVLFAAYYGWSNNANVTDTIHIKNVKLEEGSIATPWCPNSADPLYSTLGYNNNIEYDCSGYNRNGTKNGTITWDVDSPRYTTSYHFSSSQYINYAENFTFLTTGSISFWAKFNAKGSSGWLPFTGQDTGYYIMATSGGLGNFYNSNISAAGTIKYYEDSKSVLAPTNDGKWHHYVITGINMSTWTAFKINNYSSSWNSDVNYADVRIYNTILSAEDIAELYHSAVIVDNTGKSYAYEYFETQ